MQLLGEPTSKRRMSSVTPPSTLLPLMTTTSSCPRSCAGGLVSTGPTAKESIRSTWRWSGRLTVAEALLTAGADPNVRFGNSKICSPLFLAVVRSLATMRALLQHGANVNSPDDLGFTALHWAAYFDASAEIDVLVEAGADLEASSSNVRLNDKICGSTPLVGITPLHVAAYYHNRGAMAALLRNGAIVGAESDNGLTPLHIVCKTSLAFGSVEAADLLLRWDADETTTDHDGRTPKALVSGRSSLSRRVRRKLANAPADRSWRSRGMLVMCRAFPQKMARTGRGGRGGRARARTGAGRGRGGRSASRGGRNGNLLARVVELEDDEVFRAIVTFL
ncbi:unnamed protein product [Ectocarpus sp. 6 AP-2014]